eukprot:scaffold1231_cov187-Pinguiococcus_pyrenoidosus.AAC.13
MALRLPEGWKSYRTEFGEEYFHNHITGETTWDDPRVSGQSSSSVTAHVRFSSGSSYGEDPSRSPSREDVFFAQKRAEYDERRAEQEVSQKLSAELARTSYRRPALGDALAAAQIAVAEERDKRRARRCAHRSCWGAVEPPLCEEA